VRCKDETTNYDKKDKVTSVATMTVKKINTTATGKEYIMENVVTEKGKDPVTAEFSMVCQGDKFIIDMKRFLAPDQNATLKDAKVTATNLEYPSALSIGQSLADAHINVNLTQPGLPFPMNTIIDILNRKVVAQEQITTPAGTFDCFKIEYDFNMKMMGINAAMKAAEWVCLGVGTIKTETKMPMENYKVYTLLTKLEKRISRI
jgi:hypothetical protein